MRALRLTFGSLLAVVGILILATAAKLLNIKLGRIFPPQSDIDTTPCSAESVAPHWVH